MVLEIKIELSLRKSREQWLGRVISRASRMLVFLFLDLGGGYRNIITLW